MQAINQEKIEPAYLAEIVKRISGLKRPNQQDTSPTPPTIQAATQKAYISKLTIVQTEVQFSHMHLVLRKLGQ